MSMSALLLGLRDTLRAGLGYSEQECEVMPDGMPPPMAGQRFLAVHPGPFRNNDDNALSLDEEYDAMLTLTLRVGDMPEDRYGVEGAVKAVVGWYDLVLAARAMVHMNYDVIDAANAVINASGTQNGFVEPLKFRACSLPQLKGPDWFSADDEESNPPAGYALELRFGGARRPQVIEEQS